MEGPDGEVSAAEDAERQQQITKRMDRLSRDTAQANALFSSQMREAGNELAKIIGESHVELYELLGMVEAVQSQAKLKGSVGEGPNQTNYSDRSSVRILGIKRKPRKSTSSK